VPAELPELGAQLARVAEGLGGTLKELQELSRGIHPAILSQGGLGNAAKHARASVAHVGVHARAGRLRLSVGDDGVGGADPARGSGLVGLSDRVQALGGTLTVHSPAGQGTTLLIDLPVQVGRD